jgi:hypothetical protein
MGGNGNKYIVGPKDKPWYEGHPSRPSAKAIPVLTIIFWRSEDGDLYRSVGWLKGAFRDDLQLQELNQAINQHIESIVVEMIRSGLVQTEKGRFALAKGDYSESAA